MKEWLVTVDGAGGMNAADYAETSLYPLVIRHGRALRWNEEIWPGKVLQVADPRLDVHVLAATAPAWMLAWPVVEREAL